VAAARANVVVRIPIRIIAITLQTVADAAPTPAANWPSLNGG